MHNVLTANDLKKRGVSALDVFAKKGFETFITVRGEKKYVVFPIEKFHKMRELELEAALAESEADLLNGKFHEDSIDQHIKRLSKK